MPFDESRASPETPLESDYLLQQQVGAPAPAPRPDVITTAFTTAFAALRKSNLIGSTVTSNKLYEKATGGYYDIDHDFRPFDPENLKGYEEYGDHFLDVFNKKAMDAVKADIDQENRDREVLERAGLFGQAMNLAAAFLDVTSLIPATAPVKVGKGYSIIRSALRAGAAGAASKAAQEAGLHASQELRTVDESLKHIGGSALFRSVMGGRRAFLMTRLEHAAAARAFDAAKAPGFDAGTNTLHAEMMGFSVPSSADDAGTRPETSADLSIARPAASDVARDTAKLNPLLRTLHSPSASARQIGSQMMENPVYLTKTMAGEGDIAAGTTMHEFTRGPVSQAVAAQRAAYTKARKAGLSLTEKQFYQEVGRTMRRGDKSDIEGVAQAAGAWRSYVIEPLKKRAIDSGLLPKDVNAATAESYFSRLWNPQAIEADKQEFKTILRAYLDGQVSVAMAREAAGKEKTLSSLESEKADLESGMVGRMAGHGAGLADLAGGIIRHLPDEALEQFEAGFQYVAGSIARDMDAADPDRGLVSDLARIGKVDSRIADHASHGTFEFLDDADRADYVEGIVDDIHDRLTGRAADGFQPENFTLAASGPLKERSFEIPDALVEKFLEDDADLIGRRYARVMAADIDLAERFGSPDMKEAFELVRLDYAELRAGAGDDPAALKRLDLQERADMADLQAAREMLRGNGHPEIRDTNWVRILAGAGTFNYMRAMGGLQIGAVADAVRPAMVHGISAHIRDGIGPMLRGVQAAGLGGTEAALAGAIGEKILASCMASLAGITDPYADGRVFERFLGNMTAGVPLMSGLTHWDDFQKTLASRLIQNRILANAEKAAQSGFASLPAEERAYMDALGIGKQGAEDLGRLFASHGETLDGVRVANTQGWGDDAKAATTRRAFRAAINKDADSILVTKGADNVPLFASTPLGHALLRFRSLTIAANQRVLIRGLPEDKTRLVGGIVGLTTIGAFLYALKQLETGGELPDDPGTWAMEGLDRSGIFAVGFEINNALEKMGVPGVYAGALTLFPDASQKAPASHSAAGGLGLANAKGAVTGNAPGMTEGDIATAHRLMPFASLPYWRWLIDGMLVPEAKRAVRD